MSFLGFDKMNYTMYYICRAPMSSIPLDPVILQNQALLRSFREAAQQPEEDEQSPGNEMRLFLSMTAANESICVAGNCSPCSRHFGRSICFATVLLFGRHVNKAWCSIDNTTWCCCACTGTKCAWQHQHYANHQFY